MKIRVVFQGEEFRIAAGACDSLALALRRGGVPLRMDCGGTGSCKTCSVRIAGATIIYQGGTLRIPESESWMVRSCQTVLTGENGSVEVPASSLENED